MTNNPDDIKLDIPIIYVIRDPKTGYCKFWCSYCNKYHNHGQGDGHRSAHCDNVDSPYRDKGYILKTKEGLWGLVDKGEYILRLFKINDMSEISIELSEDNHNLNTELARKLIVAYKDRDYSAVTEFAIEIFKLAKLEEGYLEDLQSEGDGIPDFMFNYKGIPSFEDFYIEFKSDRDALRMNQLSSFIKLSKRFKVYILHVSRRIRGKNGDNF